MIKCIAIDDEPKALEVIKSHASRVDFIQLEKTFTDPFQAINYLNDHSIGLVFLDINMPDISGFGLLNNLLQKPLVIFTTAHSEYAIQSYEVEAVDYLLKPFDFARFLLAVTKAKDRLNKDQKEEREFFFVNTGKQKQRLFYRDIYYVEGEGNYVRYVTAGDKVLVRSSISQTVKLLPDSLFFQIHRSYIVALQWVEKIEDNHVYVADKRIPISATYRDDFLKVVDSL